MSNDRKPLYQFIAPQHWPWWLGLAVLRAICVLPHSTALIIGSSIGRFAHGIATRRRAIVRRNIELCFPELSQEQRDLLVYEHFKALGMSLIEMGLGRWASDEHLCSMTTLNGLEHLQAATAAGKGVILLSAHFTTLELSGRVLSLNCPPFDAVYRRNRSEFVTEILRTGRERSADATIEKRDIKAMIRSLRDGRLVWYAPDQSFNRKGSEIVPFFGVPSMHTTATSSLARLGRAVTLPYFSRRLPDGRYELTIGAPLPNFPSDDPIEDTKKYVRALEAHVRLCPEQYFWVHRKFKDLPSGYADYYADLEASK